MVSVRTTWWPPTAKFMAMLWPIRPAPMTPMLPMVFESMPVRCSVSVHECSRGMLMRQLTAARATRYNKRMVSVPYIILASGSQRRREIIGALDAVVEVVPPGVDERPASPGEQAEEYVASIAAEKARAVTANGHSGALVIGADTSVVLDGRSSRQAGRRS